MELNRQACRNIQQLTLKKKGDQRVSKDFIYKVFSQRITSPFNSGACTRWVIFLSLI
ncbi:MAG: hypothetical protein JWQ54_5004 [Mucilaginibacter sp.]|nr:hypothetical protein [Mucilaginibacter sp.]